MPKIKCLLVDDHTLFRQGVRRLLEMENDFEVIGESPDAGDAVEKARDFRPDIGHCHDPWHAAGRSAVIPPTGSQLSPATLSSMSRSPGCLYGRDLVGEHLSAAWRR